MRESEKTTGEFTLEAINSIVQVVVLLVQAVLVVQVFVLLVLLGSHPQATHS